MRELLKQSLRYFIRMIQLHFRLSFVKKGRGNASVPPLLAIPLGMIATPRSGAKISKKKINLFSIDGAKL